MEFFEVAKYGPAIFAIAAIVFIVVKNQSATKELTDKFMSIINNHLNDNKNAIEKNTEVIDKLEDTMKEVYIFIKRLNGRK